MSERGLFLWVGGLLGCAALGACGPAEVGTPTEGADPSLAPVCEGFDVRITWEAAFPTVPRFTYTRPQGAGEAVLTVADDPFVQTWTQRADADVGTIELPMTPGLVGAWTLTLAVGDQQCAASGVLTNGAYEAEQMPALLSTWMAGAAPHRDLHLLPAEIVEPDGGRHQSVILVDEQGRLLWCWQVRYSMRNVRIDNRGRGVWTMEQVDVLPGDDLPPVTLDLWSWTGVLIEQYTVPASHHDFDLSPDQRRLDTFAYVHDEALEAQCGAPVYADVLNEIDLDTGDIEQRWSSIETRVSWPSSCAFVPNGISFDYANGFERVGDTLGISLSGGSIAYAIGAADGTWYVVDSHNSGDLTVQADGDDLPNDLVRAPHSLLCTEGVDWGMGAPADAISCLGFNRGLSLQCDTADVFWVDRAALSAHYVATWPLKSQQEEAFPGCGSTFSHGDASLIGQPAPAGDGYTRLSMFSSNTGMLQVLGLHASPEGSSLALEYAIRPEEPGSVTGAFATSADRLGAPHRVRLAP